MSGAWVCGAGGEGVGKGARVGGGGFGLSFGMGLLALFATEVGRGSSGGNAVSDLWSDSCVCGAAVRDGGGGVGSLLAVVWLPFRADRVRSCVFLLVTLSLSSWVKKACCCLPFRMSSKTVKSASLTEAIECFGPLAFTVVMAVLTSME